MNDKEWLAKFGENLSRMIKDFGYTQSEFAKLIGVNPSSISRYVNKTQMPGASTMDNICSVLKCTIQDIINYKKK